MIQCPRRAALVLITLIACGQPRDSAGVDSATLRAIVPLDLEGATSQSIDFTQGEGEAVVGLNGHAYPDDPLELHASVGETQLWNVGNATDYDHPFHLHGFRFQVLTRDGKKSEVAEWKDTLNIPARGNAQIGIHFDDRPGMWMVHCHILDHAKLGMMGMLHLTR